MLKKYTGSLRSLVAVVALAFFCTPLLAQAPTSCPAREFHFPENAQGFELTDTGTGGSVSGQWSPADGGQLQVTLTKLTTGLSTSGTYSRTFTGADMPVVRSGQTVTSRVGRSESNDWCTGGNLTVEFESAAPIGQYIILNNLPGATFGITIPATHDGARITKVSQEVHSGHGFGAPHCTGTQIYTIDDVVISGSCAALTVGNAPAECRDQPLPLDDRYILPVSVTGLSSTPLSTFAFTLLYNIIDLDFPVEVRVSNALLDHWLVTTELTITGPRLTFRTRDFPNARPIPDGDLVLLTFEVEAGSGVKIVPVLIDAFSLSGFPVPVGVNFGSVNLGFQKDTRVRLGSTSVMAGQTATVPVSVEGLCQFSILGTPLPRWWFDLTFQYDDAGLPFPTASRQATVVPPSWDFNAAPSGANGIQLFAEELRQTKQNNLTDGVIAHLKFKTERSTPLGTYAVDITEAKFHGSPTVVLGERPHAEVTVKERVCVKPDDVLLDWEQFRAEVIGKTPLTRNRDCVAGHFARFSLFEDRLENRTKLLVTRPLNHADLRTMTTEAFQKIIEPPDPDPTCVDNKALMTGWVSYADWLPTVDPGFPATGERFLFTTRNFPDKGKPTKNLGRAEESTELLSPIDHDRLVKFFPGDVADKIFMVPNDNLVYSPNYAEPDGEFSAANPSDLISMGGFVGGTSRGLWEFDVFERAVYFNDPIERGKRGVTLFPQAVIKWDKNGDNVTLGDAKDAGLYAASCSGKIAMSLRQPEPSSPFIFHSTFFGGASVTGAGHALLRDGKLCYIDNESGHYRPTKAEFTKFLANSLPGVDAGTIYEHTRVSFATPDTSEECRALVAEYVGLVVEPPTLHLTAPLGGTASGTVKLTSFQSTQFHISPKQKWLVFAPTDGALAAGVPADLTVTGKCGKKKEVRGSTYQILGPDGSDLTGGQTNPRVFLNCR